MGGFQAKGEALRGFLLLSSFDNLYIRKRLSTSVSLLELTLVNSLAMWPGSFPEETQVMTAPNRIGTFVRHALKLSAITLALSVGAAHAASPSFIGFESGHVRPIVMSADGTRLFAVNTPNNTLEVFKITATGLELQSRIPVGMEPVSTMKCGWSTTCPTA